MTLNAHSSLTLLQTHNLTRVLLQIIRRNNHERHLTCVHPPILLLLTALVLDCVVLRLLLLLLVQLVPDFLDHIAVLLAMDFVVEIV